MKSWNGAKSCFLAHLYAISYKPVWHQLYFCWSIVKVILLIANCKTRKYCWWKKSCTSWYGKYPTIYRVLHIPGVAGSLPSTVVMWFYASTTILEWCWPSVTAFSVTRSSTTKTLKFGHWVQTTWRDCPNKGAHVEVICGRSNKERLYEDWNMLFRIYRCHNHGSAKWPQETIGTNTVPLTHKILGIINWQYEQQSENSSWILPGKNRNCLSLHKTSYSHFPSSRIFP